MKRILLLALVVCASNVFAQSAAPLFTPKQQFFDNNGYPLAGGLVYTCVAGSSCPGTPLATYTDSTAGFQNQNPIVLDSAGRAAIWGGSSLYKIVVQDSAFNPISTQDNVPAGALGLSGANGATQVKYTAIGTGAVSRTVAAKLNESVSVMDFGAAGNGSTDDTAAFSAAINQATVAGGDVLVPCGSYLVSSTINVVGYVSPEKSIRLHGAAQRCAVLKAGADNLTMMLSGNTAEIDDLEFQPNGHTNVVGLEVHTNVTTRNLKFLGAFLYPMKFPGDVTGSTGVFYSRHYNTYIDCQGGCQYGEYLVTANLPGTFWVNLNQFFGDQVRGTTKAGTYCDGCADNQWYGADRESNTGVGFWFEYSQNNSIYGADLENNTLGTMRVNANKVNNGLTVNSNSLDIWAQPASTTGTISLSTPNTMTVASATSLALGKPIYITGAGAAGVALRTSITGISGTTITIADAASTAVTSAVVYGPDLYSPGSVSIQGESLNYLYAPYVMGMRWGGQDLLLPVTGATAHQTYCQNGSGITDWYLGSAAFANQERFDCVNGRFYNLGGLMVGDLTTTPPAGGIQTSGQIKSTLATGTAPLSIASTTPVTTLTVANHPTAYSSGSQQTGYKIGNGAVTLSSGTATYNLSSSMGITFSSASSYACIGNNETTKSNPINIVRNSGTQITVNGTGSDSITLICSGT